MLKNYRATIRASFVGYVVQAMVNLFAPLLFVTFQNQYGIPLTQITVLITVSVLIGVCVSVSGTVGFVGLVMPHIARMLVGPNHRRLLPASLFSGAIFLLLADLTARTLLSPIELSIGVVTSMVGAVAFVVIFYRTRKGR